MLSDVDDTLKSSGGVSVGSVALGGIDTQYSRGITYPGVFNFMVEVSKGGGGEPMNIAVLTARAEEFKAALELKPTSPLCVKAAAAASSAGYPGWGVGPVLYGSVAEWINQPNKGRRKFANFEALKSQGFEGVRYVYVGDTGEYDGECGEQMLRYYPESVLAVFLHVVSSEPRPAMPLDKIVNGRPILFFRTYAGAATKAWEAGLISREAVERVVEQCYKDLEGMGIGPGDERWEDVKDDEEAYSAISR